MILFNELIILIFVKRMGKDANILQIQEDFLAIHNNTSYALFILLIAQLN